MHFISQKRYNPKIQGDDRDYRIKESYHNFTGRVCSRVMLNVGFIDDDLRSEDIRDIGKCLTYIYDHQHEQDLFGDALSLYNDFVREKAAEYWSQMVESGSVDAVKRNIGASVIKAKRLIDIETLKHTDAREIGAEWICLQAIRELEIDKFLKDEGWSETQINTTLAHLIVRTIYTPNI